MSDFSTLVRPAREKSPYDLPSSNFALDSLRYFDSLPDSAHVRRPVVLALFGFSNATLYRLIKIDRFPVQVKLGPHVSAWNVGVLRAHMAKIKADGLVAASKVPFDAAASSAAPSATATPPQFESA